MADYKSVLQAARQLSQDDRLRLIDALWKLVPPDASIPLHEDWALELERRVDAIKKNNEKSIPWEVVRSEALRRIGHDDIS